MKKLLFFVLAFCLVLPLAAQKNKKKVSRHAAKMGFQQLEVFGMKYCKKKVGNWSDPLEKAAVILFLHGAGERGSDNSSQLTHGAAQILLYCKETKMKALLIFPQCPSDQQWVNVPWGETEHTMPPKPSSALSLALAVLDQECADRAIDKDRIYIVGLSMGGYGVWDALSRYPKKFAGAIAICGGADTKQADYIKFTPVLFYHGDKDNVVPVERGRKINEALKEQGATNFRYVEVPNMGHASWNVAFRTRENWDWLFKQVRGERDVPKKHWGTR